MFLARANCDNGVDNKKGAALGPTYFNTDLSVTKDFKIPHWEGALLGVGAQFFNVLNHPHFDQPDAHIASPTFGSIINPVSFNRGEASAPRNEPKMLVGEWEAPPRLSSDGRLEREARVFSPLLHWRAL